VSFFDTDEALAAGSAWLDSVHGLPNGGSRILSAREAAKLLPDSTAQYKGALYGPDEGLTEPKLAAPGIALGARKLGAKIYQNCAVRGIEREGGRVSAVVTEKGTVRTSIVILAGGVWSPVFAKSVGIELAQLNGFSSYLSIEPQEGPEFSGMLPGSAFRKEIDGGYTVGAISGLAPITPSTFRYLFDLLPAIMGMSSIIRPTFSWSNFWREWNIPKQWPLNRESPFEKLRILQPEVDNIVDVALRSLKKALPAFQNARVRERWAGAIMTTLDNMPIISAAEQIPGLFLGTGFLYGLTMGPGAGELLADLATGRTPAIDISPFRHSRFIDGTKLKFQT
jgi:glycine/D-amino acid oxidase-like deaminating enzyme